MPNIRPVSDLRNNFTEISKTVHESWEENQAEWEIYNKLREAEIEAKMTDVRLSHEELFASLRNRIADV